MLLTGLKGMSWFMRKLIASVTITLYVKHYKDDDGVEHIDVEQIGTGGFKGNFEPRQIDGQVRPLPDHLPNARKTHLTMLVY